ncbi:Crp/Fnr family transcriptional regulator [Sediminispirochaeta smaragdinae]|jgi:CRP-like cAMP-binding protein|uniref:Transcriptional regulator, Crp/Fnr family n=1 Tax=Sediminispirochaeta smaragdinae (strain DSM 11293 / JCM 15392 / SEBR 4228) TaxID=573413 RepID=E1R9H4_SEDSS|nr:Crp/Fnr family transcriptional regulator [Sediminispirochaeta smaragdinae]ADK83143.1 transcriptional regulator, Crp/Fnr family [Sediminispirochaeta smaragdinae DSM 11293]
MKENWTQEEIDLLLKAPLFDGFTKDTIFYALNCLRGKKEQVDKERVLYPVGEKPMRAAIILKGSVDISQINRDGHLILISRMGKGDLIAEAFVCSASSNDFLDIRSSSDTILLLLALPSKENRKQRDCPYYNVILRNLVRDLAEKAVVLNKKVQLLGQRTLKDKLLLFFENLSREQKSRTVHLTFTREVLASLVSADRSSVCRELSRMQQAGLILIHKNTIKLLENS